MNAFHCESDHRIIQKKCRKFCTLILLASFSLGYVLKCYGADQASQDFENPFNPTSEANYQDSDSIKKNINYLSSQKAISDNYKQVELVERTEANAVQNYGINNGLYFGDLARPREDKMTDNHFKSYCNGVAWSDGKNKEANLEGAQCIADPLIAEGDIKISTFLSGSILDTNTENASRFFIQNLVQPFPGSDFQDVKSVAEIDPKQFAKYLAQQAILSVVREPFAEMVAKRTPQPVTVNVINKEGNVEPGPKNQVSIMSKMETDASKQFLNQDWYDALAKSQWQINKIANFGSIQNIDAGKLDEKTRMILYSLQPLFEITKMEATRTWIEYERYKQGERIEALLAGILMQLNQQAASLEALTTGIKGTAQINPTKK